MNINTLQKETTQNLLQNILPAWMGYADLTHGGFLGRVTGNNKAIHDANKGGVLNARILWSFSAAYRLLKDPLYLAYATRAKEVLLNDFYDNTFGGIYWTIDHKGNPVDTKKQVYAQGFALYGLSEYARATGDADARNKAIELFETIEQKSYDPVSGGYLEAFARDWSELADMRLSAKDANEKKTMNTHLHILEPYTNLYRIWPDEKLRNQIHILIRTFLDHIIDHQTHHLNLFFDEQWNNKYNIVSYGHDIEASWLIHEAAMVLGDKTLLSEVENMVLKIADAAAEGIQPDGSMVYELDKTNNHLDSDRHWWVQAEAVVGYLNAWELSNKEAYLQKAGATWSYIKTNLVDHRYGEWHWSIKAEGTINHTDDKAGFWKCPYHNSRMCFEILERSRIIHK